MDLGTLYTRRGKKGKSKLVRDANKQPIHTLSEVKIEPSFRYNSGISEFDRVLGGSLTKGATALLGGEPGIGKSTLMLQVLGSIKNRKLLYVSGEERLLKLEIELKD